MSSLIPVEYVPYTEWRGIEMWIGRTEKIVDLLGADGIWMLNKGLKGLHFPPVDHHWDDPTQLPGSVWRGQRVKARDVFWPLMIESMHGEGVAAVADWMRRETKFWDILSPEKTVWWAVQNPVNGEKRFLRCRHEPDDGHAFDIDPTLHAFQTYGVKLTAEDGLWEGDPTGVRFTVEHGIDFFGGQPLSPDPAVNSTHRGPIFYVSAGNNLGSARFTNPGNVPAWPRYTIPGPFEKGHVGLDGHLITFPFKANQYQTLVIDTDPQVQTATLGGVDVTADLTVADWAPIPPGADLRLDLDVVGAQEVKAEITPRYWRAFG